MKLTSLGPDFRNASVDALSSGARNDFTDPAFVRANRVRVDGTLALEARVDRELFLEMNRGSAPDEVLEQVLEQAAGIDRAGTITEADLEAITPEVARAHRMLKQGEGECRDGDVVMLGWQSLPDRITEARLEAIIEASLDLAGRIDSFLSLGIGGSYLGILATKQALTPWGVDGLTRDERGGLPASFFLGNSMDPDYHADVFHQIRDGRIGVNVISKSGTTRETAMAFRMARRFLEETIGAEAAAQAIFATTDPVKGALREMADDKGYRTFTVPADVGGRYSVLTDVGLVGLPLMGVDIKEFVAGFREMKARTEGDDFEANPAMLLAALRTLAYRKGKRIEMIATNSYALTGLAEWAKQLFPESEGHLLRGLFPSAGFYSRELHAVGQAVQDGERNICELLLELENPTTDLAIPQDDDDRDRVNHPELRSMGAFNRAMMEGTAIAHHYGGVPVTRILIPNRNAFCLGQVYFLMERTAAITGYLLDINPFVQPAVVAYKNLMNAVAGAVKMSPLVGRLLDEARGRPSRVV